jgi:pyrroline-5-carboxylate reductase
MKVGVLGSGDVAKALADGFIKHGHVVMGTRDPSKLKDWDRID